MWVTGIDYHSLIALKWGGWKGKMMMVKLAGRIIKSRLTGQRIATSGSALLTRLRLALRDANVPLWLNSPIKSVIFNDDGRVVGAVIEKEGKTVRVGARRGVVLATGGFEWSKEMRAKYQPEVPVGWSNGSPDNTGDGHKVGEEAGAQMELMDDAWWMPAMDLGAGVWPLVAERCFPGQIIVNETGKRFVNEATPYTDFGHVLIEGQKSGVKHIPCYMIIDDRAWKRNLIAGHLPGKKMPKAWIDSGKVFQADTLEELAAKIGVPGDALKETVERWNSMVRKGVDEDFHRGESAYANYYGDPSYPRPNLGEIDKPPYIAFTLVPGDLGTKGGVLTDENARALRPDGSVIEGFYATGNCSAAVMGHSYAGPGATIGPAMTFGYVAANDLAKLEPADIEPATASATS
jgi:succinate dehydrogenase/fumarate reductase flavoprotein subunit